MTFDANALLAGLLVSSIGFVLLVYGRRMGRAPQIAAGSVLLLYPLFVSSALVILGIAAAILILMWVGIARGL